jgi:hypothetical protein
MSTKRPTLDRRKQRTSRKLDEKKVLELRAQGLAVTDIATHQGVASSTVWRFLDRTKPQQEALERFKTGRADVLADVQAKSLDVQVRLLNQMDDGFLSTLTPHAKNGLLQSVNTVFGTVYDKERLERGKSTQNVGVVARIMGEALEKVHLQSAGQEDHEPSPS